MRVLSLTHGPSVGPGVFGDTVRDAGHELVGWSVPQAERPPEGHDAVLVFGGAMHPDQEERHRWLARELRFLEDALERGTPIFGVCLGAQLLARAAGARVLPASEAEVGWCEVVLTPAGAVDPVASSLPERFDAFQWHSYTHELPAGAVELARSPVCTQAFRLDRAIGVQFHPEVRAEHVERWLGEDPDDVTDVAVLREQTAVRMDAWNELGRALCTAFLADVS